MRRFIVTYGPTEVTECFRGCLEQDKRLEPGDEFRAWSEKDLPAWVKPGQRPFGYVAYILDQALIQQADFVLWLHPDTKVIKSLDPIWRLLDYSTSWFVSTGELCKPNPVINACLNTNDPSLPHVTDRAFGLDLRMPPTLRFLVELKRHSRDGCLEGAAQDQFDYLFALLAKKFELNAEEPNHFVSFQSSMPAVLPESVLLVV